MAGHHSTAELAEHGNQANTVSDTAALTGPGIQGRGRHWCLMRTCRALCPEINHSSLLRALLGVPHLLWGHRGHVMVDHGNERPTQRTAERDGAAGIQQATSQASLRRDLMQRPLQGTRLRFPENGQGKGGVEGRGRGKDRWGWGR